MLLDSWRRLVIPGLLAAAAASGCSGEAVPAPGAIDMRPLDVAARAGSLAPNLAAGPEGSLVLSWVEPQEHRHVLRYAVLGESGWSRPRSVAAGDDWFVNWADFPSVVPLSGSLWAAHWLVRQPAGGYAYDVLVSLSTDAGASWSVPVRPHDDDTPTEHGFVTLFPRGDRAGLVWLDGRNMIHPADEAGEATHGMTLRAASVTRDRTIEDAVEVDGLTCDCCQTDVAVTARAAIAVYRDRSTEEIRDIRAARLTGAGWLPGQPVAADGWNIAGCPVNGPVIAADGALVAVAWFTAADDRPRVRLARSTDAGETWSAPVEVAEGEASGHAGIALLPGGRVAVSWACERRARGRLCLRTVADDDALGPVHVLESAGEVPALSVPQLARHGEWLVAAWTEQGNGSTRIASAAVPLAALQ